MIQKLANGAYQQFGSNLQAVDVQLTWDGNVDLDLIFAGANNNIVNPADLVFHRQQQLLRDPQAIQVGADAQTGDGFAKVDERGTINLARITQMNPTWQNQAMTPITEVAVGVCNQDGVLGAVKNARIQAFDATTRQQILDVDLDASFYRFPGAKIGEFQLQPNGTWRFGKQLGGFSNLNNMAWALAQDPQNLEH